MNNINAQSRDFSRPVSEGCEFGFMCSVSEHTRMLCARPTHIMQMHYVLWLDFTSKFPQRRLKIYKKSAGFSAIELLIYMSIFVVSAIFLVAILTAVIRVQTRQVSSREIDEQVAFISRTIEQAVRGSSLIDIPAGVPTSILILRTQSSSTDPTRIYASGTVLYLDQGSATYALTESGVILQSFSVTKYDNPGSAALVDISVSLGRDSTKPGGSVSRSFKTALSRVSAAEFDSSVYPTSDNALDLGIAAKKWRDGYFAGDVDIAGRLGIGTSPSASARIKSSGDIGFSNSASGLILVAPGGNCYRVRVADDGSLFTSVAACP